MKILITGGCGFLGSNLASASLAKGHEIYLLDNLSRSGASQNLEWLKGQGKFAFVQEHIQNFDAVIKAVRDFKPDTVFHLAGQVAMTTSIADPRADFETNVIGGHNVIEAVRRYAPHAVVTYSSTNKVYGDFSKVRFEEQATRYVCPDFPEGFDESLTLDFQSPYGCSKGATDQYMLDYARMYDLKTVVFRHSTIFGGRQFSTFDQGWVGWFVDQAVKVKRGTLAKPFTISGDGKQVRDVLFADDLVDCYFSAVESIRTTSGQAFNMGGGMKNSLSLLELFSILESELGIELKYERLPWRQADQKVFVADTKKARERFGFAPKIDRLTGIRRMLEWIQSQ
jgi:CDP-paratose 2-epimerase